MTRSRLVLASGIAAGLVANYWALETLLADRSDPAGSWISDLGARTESTGLLFDLLEVASGLLIVLFAILILPPLGRRSRQLGWAVVALIAVGVCTVVDGAFPLSCGESLAEPCELRYDAVDLIHGGETFLSIALTIVMFGLFAAGLRAEAESGLRRLGRWAGIAGVAMDRLQRDDGRSVCVRRPGRGQGPLSPRQPGDPRRLVDRPGDRAGRASGAAGREAVPRAWQDRR